MTLSAISINSAKADKEFVLPLNHKLQDLIKCSINKPNEVHNQSINQSINQSFYINDVTFLRV